MSVCCRIGSLALFLAMAATACGAEELQNLVENSGFEEELSPVWEKRTPENAQRKLDRQAETPHAGKWCLALESRDEKPVRLRHGNDRRLVIPPQSVVELSAWVKSELAEKGRAGLQFYCMDQDGKILAQPQAYARESQGVWRQVRLLAKVPKDTAYAMVYLQTDGAARKVLFDDVSLRVVRKPKPAMPVKKIGVLTDLPVSDECHKNLKTLLAEGLVELKGDQLPVGPAGCEGAIVLLRSATSQALEPFADFARQGRSVFMDLRAFAAWQGLSLIDCQHSGLAKSGDDPSVKTPATRQMQVGLTVVKATPITAGFQAGQIVPYAGPNGHLMVLASVPPGKSIDILATAGGKPALVEMRVGKGRIVAADTLSLREPHHNYVDGYYKYLFVANTVADPQRLMLAEYYPRKLTYGEFVEAMRETAKLYPSLRMDEEGPACGDYKIYSLNIGKPGAPMYFLYGATHGSEWEPGYGLLTFAKHLAQGRLAGIADLDKVCVKIVPILNPSGYDLRQRHNAHHVDLNRQGDYFWEQYTGRDSNRDGRHGAGDYDWKGESPFCEPEAQTYRRIIQAPNLHCTLDFHGNTGAQDNKIAIVPVTAREDCMWRVLDLQNLVNHRLRMRYILRQNSETSCSPYLLDHVHADSARPVLQNTGARGRYGMLVELTAGYPDSYGTVLQTEVTCEICRALFEIFRP